MEAQEDLVKIGERTEWVLPLVNVEKKDKLIIAVGTRKIGKFIKHKV